MLNIDVGQGFVRVEFGRVFRVGFDGLCQEFDGPIQIAVAESLLAILKKRAKRLNVNSDTGVLGHGAAVLHVLLDRS